MKFIDCREPEIIRSKMTINGWVQDKLESADYGFFTSDNLTVGIERKTTVDLLNSISNRLPLQLNKMHNEYSICILLIEGKWGKQGNQIKIDSQIYNYTWESVWNLLRTWQDKGISLELTLDYEHTIQRIDEIYKYYQKYFHSGGINNRIQSGDCRLSMLLQIDGIGIETAKELVFKYQSIQNIANTDYVDMAKLIGMKKAISIYNYFRKCQ